MRDGRDRLQQHLFGVAEVEHLGLASAWDFVDEAAGARGVRCGRVAMGRDWGLRGKGAVDLGVVDVHGHGSKALGALALAPGPIDRPGRHRLAVVAAPLTRGGHAARRVAPGMGRVDAVHCKVAQVCRGVEHLEGLDGDRGRGVVHNFDGQDRRLHGTFPTVLGIEGGTDVLDLTVSNDARGDPNRHRFLTLFSDLVFSPTITDHHLLLRGIVAQVTILQHERTERAVNPHHISL
mmetsp:Transcript_87153/g.144957  ORF Transcript_87153/g.144957 Transcript_87153/m.144957 type:complete len:235 (+) Transcript_87153:6254-6958(+)